MVSDFRKKQLLHVFNAFFDTNRSGNIYKKDFEQAIQKISELLGYKLGDAKYKKVKDILLKIWDVLHSELIPRMMVKYQRMSELRCKTSSPRTHLQLLTGTCTASSSSNDASNDGSIDVEEFSSVYAFFGLDKQESVEAFHKMAKGKETVSFEEFMQLWKEYYVSEDQDAPRNFIFGCYICGLSKNSHFHSH